MFDLNQGNRIAARNVYPTAPGQTAGASGGSAGGVKKMAAEGQAAAVNPVSFAVAVGQSGNIVVSGFVLLALVFGVMMLSEKLGSSERSIKATFFNVLIIGLAAAVGTPIWKYLATRFPIPGVSGWILAG